MGRESLSGAGEKVVRATRILQEIGQSIWLDNMRRELLDSGTLQRYIEDYSVTGLTSNPSIFERALKTSDAYDPLIAALANESHEQIFFKLALNDITKAADLFRPIYERTNGVDGWASIEVSPLLCSEAASTLKSAKELFSRAQRPNVMIKIPGTKESLPAVEEAIYLGIPVNVTLLFSREQYLAAAEMFIRGVERRIAAGLPPFVGSVASVFVSRWDAVKLPHVPDRLRNKLGIAMAMRTYKAARSLLTSARWQRIYSVGARPQRLLWASTGTKDPVVRKALYVDALVAPMTVNTMPEETLNSLAQETRLGGLLPSDGGDCEETLAAFTKLGIDLDSVAATLQKEGAAAFVASWHSLLRIISERVAILRNRTHLPAAS